MYWLDIFADHCISFTKYRILNSMIPRALKNLYFRFYQIKMFPSIQLNQMTSSAFLNQVFCKLNSVSIYSSIYLYISIYLFFHLSIFISIHRFICITYIYLSSITILLSTSLGTQLCLETMFSLKPSKNIPVVFMSYSVKIWGKSVKGFLNYDWTYKQTDRYYCFIYIDLSIYLYISMSTYLSI